MGGKGGMEERNKYGVLFLPGYSCRPGCVIELDFYVWAGKVC